MTEKPVSNETLLQQLQWRYATKSYDPNRKIPPADWQTLEQALLLSASSYGLQPYRFLVITDPAVKAKLPAISWGQTPPRDCSHFVLFAGKRTVTAADIDHFLARTAQVRGVTTESLAPFRQVLIGDLVEGPRSKWIAEWAARQAYIALGNLLTSAALLAIDATPMEGIEPEKYDATFDLPAKGLRALCACALGYRAADDKYAAYRKARLPAEELFIHI